MKLTNALVILSISLASTVPISASPVESSCQLDTTGLSSTFAQFYPGVVGAIAKLQPDAAQKVEAAAKQACDAIKDIPTADAQPAAAQSAGGSIFSPISNTLGGFISSILPNIAPVLTAIMAIATGDTSAAPQIVSLAQKTCNVVFQDA